MDIKIDGNPGTGNTFQEINIGQVQNYNPNATTVINNYYGTREANSDHSAKTEKRGGQEDVVDTATIRQEILTYVSCLRPLLSDEWKSRYLKVWEDILNLDIVAAIVYEPGKQQGTNFNRNLVANIIYYLDGQGAYKDKYNATTMTFKLEGDKDHSVRSALRNNPPAEVVSRLNRYFE